MYKMNNTKQHGGEILGKGAWGLVIDACDLSINSFCKMVSLDDKVSIYVDDSKSFIADIQEFINWISDYRGVVKTFSRKDKFIREIQENEKVLKIHENRPEYIALEYPTYNKIKIAGIEVKSNKGIIYAIFGHKCNPIYKLNGDNIYGFISDMLKRIKVINSNGYYHNDIKMANIMFCNNRYILIDWGASGYQSDNYLDYNDGGAPIFSSPMKLYLTSKHNKLKHIRTQNIPYIVLKSYILKGRKDYDYISHGMFTPDSDPKRQKYLQIKKLLTRRYTHFLMKLKEFDYNEKKIYEHYRKSFDVYMLGMTIFHAIYKFDLTENTETLINIVKKFTSLKHPLDVDSAINVFNENVKLLFR